MKTGFLAVPFFLAQIAGCQIMEVQPSAAIDMPRKLPKPSGLVETSEEGTPVAMAARTGVSPESSKVVATEPLTESAVQKPNQRIPSLSGADSLATNVPDSPREKIQQTAVNATSPMPGGYLVAAIPSDPPLPVPNAASTGDPLVSVYKRSFDWFQSTDSFTCRMVRREVMGARKRPEELISFQYRKNPYSIHLKWLGQEGKGRELVYIEGKFENRIQIRLAGGDIPFMPAGKRMTFSLDSPLVRSSSRHGVQEASFGFMLSTVGTMIAHQKQGTPKLGTVQYVGKVNREDLGAVVEMIEVKLAPGTEDGLPQGGRRLIGFDPREGMPVLVQTFDENGQEVEFYRYDRFICKGLDDIDFDPEVLWGKQDLASKP